MVAKINPKTNNMWIFNEDSFVAYNRKTNSAFDYKLFVGDVVSNVYNLNRFKRFDSKQDALLYAEKFTKDLKQKLIDNQEHIKYEFDKLGHISYYEFLKNTYFADDDLTPSELEPFKAHHQKYNYIYRGEFFNDILNECKYLKNEDKVYDIKNNKTLTLKFILE